ncbi:cytidylate kinase [Anaerolineaceae bacterium oral taxon 439]|nr:cytidylate kinase [Anaerolineaceae bacterium oral taxon 439]
MTKRPSQIAIDGPASSGKTSVGKRLAQRLGYLFFDTGLVYRAAAVAALNGGETLPESDEIVRRVRAMTFELRNDPSGSETRIFLNQRDCSDLLHLPVIDANVSTVAALPDVRALLTGQQRQIGRRGSAVLVGRDIGTVVLPDAELKIFLLASTEVRARRRQAENIANGIDTTYESVLKNIQQRDENDSKRAVAPLIAASDAIQIDTDDLDLEGVVDEILKWVG